MNIVIRTGKECDATALAELAARTFQETFVADNRPEDMALHISRAYGPSQQQRELVDRNITTLLAEVEGHLARYAQLRFGAAPDCVTEPSAQRLECSRIDYISLTATPYGGGHLAWPHLRRY